MREMRRCATPLRQFLKLQIQKNARWLIWRFFKYGVDEGDRTLDNGSHNPVLYQLSYAHHSAFTTLPVSRNKQLKQKKKAATAALFKFGADGETRTLTPCGAGT